MKTARLSCGCTYAIGDREAWLSMCVPHRAEADALHARAHAEHLIAMLDWDARGVALGTQRIAPTTRTNRRVSK